jgi:cobalamin biosynthesis Mg chelatase CobN
MRRAYLLLLVLTLISCRVHKDIQLQQSKIKANLSSDSTYTSYINDSIQTYRNYVIEFDSAGKAKTAKISELVKQAKKSVSKGEVKKDVEIQEQTKVESKKIDKEQGTIPFSLIVFALFVVVGIVAYLLLK